MRIEKIEWSSGSDCAVSVGIVVEETKEKISLTNEVLGAFGKYTTKSVVDIEKKSIRDRKVLQKDGWFSKDIVELVPVIPSFPKISTKALQESIKEAGKMLFEKDKHNPSKQHQKNSTKNIKLVRIKSEPVPSSAEVLPTATDEKVFKTRGRKYSGPYAGKFDHKAFRIDMENMSVKALAEKHGMSWGTAKSIVTYMTSGRKAMKTSITESNFIELYKKHSYAEIAQLLGISSVAVGAHVHRLAKLGKLQLKNPSKRKKSSLH